MKKIFRNTTKYNRAIHDKENPYLKVSSKLINDTRLSDGEIGLFIKLLNNSDDYVFNSEYVKKEVSTLGGAKISRGNCPF